MTGPNRITAAKGIFIAVALALLLLAFESANESFWVMALIAAAALVIFIGIRNATAPPPPTLEQIIERERNDALQWQAKTDAQNPEPPELLD